MLSGVWYNWNISHCFIAFTSFTSRPEIIMSWHNLLTSALFLRLLVLFFSHFGEIYVISVFYVIFSVFMLRKWNFAVILSYKRWGSFNVIALFLLEKRARTFFHNTELWMVLFKHVIVSVLKSPLNYFLADSFTVIHHTNTPLLE